MGHRPRGQEASIQEPDRRYRLPDLLAWNQCIDEAPSALPRPPIMLVRVSLPTLGKTIRIVGVPGPPGPRGGSMLVCAVMTGCEFFWVLVPVERTW